MANAEGYQNLTFAGKCCRNLLFAFNVLFLICGVLAILLGLFIAVFPLSRSIATLMGSNLYIVAGFILILSGIAVVVVAFCGCCGAKYENKFLLGVYFCSLLAIFVIEFIAGILALAFYTQAEVYAEEYLENGILEEYGQPGHEDLTDAWNYVQDWFQCCGLEGNTTEAAVIYTMTVWYVQSNTRVPKSCCAQRNEIIVNLQECQDRQNMDWYTHVNNEGCYDIIYHTAIIFSTVLAGVGIALSSIQFFGMAFSFCLFRSL